MLNHYYYLLYPLSVTSRNYQYKDKIPLIYYTHGGKQVTATSDKKSIMKRVERLKKRYNNRIFLFRNPLSVIVSYYNYVIHGKHYPDGDDKWKSMDFSEFIRSKYGLERTVCHMKAFEECVDSDDILILKYEELRKNTKAIFIQILKSLNSKIIDEIIIDKAISYCNIKEMKKREKEGEANEFEISTRGRFVNSSGLKVREGNLEGYKEYFKSDSDKQFAKDKCKGFGNLLDEYNLT